MLLDNEALYDNCFRTLRFTTPTHRVLDHLVCASISGVTMFIRLPSRLSSGIDMLCFDRTSTLTHNIMTSTWTILLVNVRSYMNACYFFLILSIIYEICATIFSVKNSSRKSYWCKVRVG